MVDCGGLENRCTARYPGFESLSLRWKELQNKENPCKLILYRDFCFWCIAKISISKHSFGVLFGVPVCLQCQVHLLSK